MMADYLDLTRTHAPVVIIAVLLVGAALSVAAQGRASWILAVMASAGAAVVALDMAWRLLVLGATQAVVPDTAAIGADGVGAFAAAVLTVFGLVTLLGAAPPTIAAEPRASAFGAALALCVIAGWCGASFARDFVTLFLCVEIGWLAAVGLVALSERGLNGALHMLTAGGAAAALMFVGIALLVRSTGADQLAALASERIGSPAAAAAGLALAVVALALKAGAAPVETWGAVTLGRSGPIAAACAGVLATAGALLALVRLSAFAAVASPISVSMSAVAASLGIAAVVIGSAQAIGTLNVRRLAAYAGSVQAGCVLASLSLGWDTGFEAALLQVLALCGAQLAMIMGARLAGGDGSLRSLNGLGRRAPLAAAALTAGALSYMGAPLSLVFLGRWRLIEAALGVGWWWLAAAAIGASLAGVFYGGRLIERIYFRHATSSTLTAAQPGALRWLLAPALALSIVVTAAGLNPGFIWRAAAHASTSITEHQP